MPPTVIDKKTKILLISIVTVIIAVIIFALKWLFGLETGEQAREGWYLFSFATGITMIVLPCTLPLAFVVVPLSMGKGVRKGLGIALAFSIGVTTTLSLYGALAAIVGGLAVDTLGAPLETVKNWVYFIAGIFAYLFALGEVGLVKFRMPSYTGAAPAFIQKQGDFLKPLLLGLFLGNIGVGCPHPATPMLLIEAGVNGNIFYGWSLFLVHAIGRILPLMLLATLGIAGVNGLSWLIARKDKIERATGWAMVFVAGFIMTLGLFTHDWWVNSGIHTQLEKVTQEETLLDILGSKLGTGNTHRHGAEVDEGGLFGLPINLGNWYLVALWIIPIWWWWAREKKRSSAIPETATTPEREASLRLIRTKRWTFTVLTLLLGILFIYILPHNFLKHEAVGTGHAESEHDAMMGAQDGAMNHEDHGAGGHTPGQLHESSAVTEGLVVNMTIVPPSPIVGQKIDFIFNTLDLPNKIAVDDLQIEHEKLMHVIGVREDLSGFFHVHPRKTGSGKFELQGKFNEPGYFKIWTDVTRNNKTHSFGHDVFLVKSGENTAVERSKAKPIFQESVVTDGYRVDFSHESPVIGTPFHLGFTVRNSAGSIVPVEQYLAADMHLAAIKDDLTQYIHTHPSDHLHGALQPVENMALAVKALASAGHDEATPHHDTPVETPTKNLFSAQVPFEVTFQKPGIYKLYAQFRPQGILLPKKESLVAEFFLEVTNQTASASSVPARSSHEPPVSRPLLALISLVLIAGLSTAVARYLKAR